MVYPGSGYGWQPALKILNFTAAATQLVLNGNKNSLLQYWSIVYCPIKAFYPFERRIECRSSGFSGWSRILKI